jgi:hypothetical protein
MNVIRKQSTFFEGIKKRTKILVVIHENRQEIPVRRMIAFAPLKPTERELPKRLRKSSEQIMSNGRRTI